MNSLKGIPEGVDARRRQILNAGAWFLLPSPASAVFENAHLAPKSALLRNLAVVPLFWLVVAPRNQGQVWPYCFLQCRVGCHLDSVVQVTSKEPSLSTWPLFRHSSVPRLPEVSKFSERRTPGNKPDDLGLKERTLTHGRCCVQLEVLLQHVPVVHLQG